jgi:esterase
MKLNYRQYSTVGHPLLILHGLFGSLGNWNWHSNKLSEQYAVCALDLRNHGASPHADQMDYPAMAADIIEFMAEHKISSAHLLGHSMGGKVAMQLALEHPNRVDKLIVADIAPVKYASEHDQIFDGLQAIDLEQVQSRTEADKVLAEYVDDEVVRQFLLTNLLRGQGGGFYWRINLPVLAKSYLQLRAAPAGDGVFDKPVLFIKGALSNYITEDHQQEIEQKFPQARLKTIMQTGHWLHAEKPQTFYHLVSDFLSQPE